MTARTQALHTMAEFEVVFVDEIQGIFRVKSVSTSGTYTVVWDGQKRTATCDCPAGRHHETSGRTCWHMDLVAAAHDRALTQRYEAITKAASTIADAFRKLSDDELLNTGRLLQARVEEAKTFWPTSNDVDVIALRVARRVWHDRHLQA